ncbi:ribokinase [Chitinophaga sp. MM2321]|uniref:ribokinase n=1 Tax=Chitinophaga sp. MM2321 TaxID=3137178 RepID=UPI0032D5991D
MQSLLRRPITVIGSSNTDMVIKAPRIPGPGETILGGTFFMNSGGKGANQAVATARLGGQVHFITALGEDVFGQKQLQAFKDDGINTDHILIDKDQPSGIALITVDDQGENCIVVAPGANAALLPAAIEKATGVIAGSDIILVQLEIPMETVQKVLELATLHKKKVILNPAPAQKLSTQILNGLYLITPNSTEASMLTGLLINNVTDCEKAAAILRTRGVQQVVITLGSKGAYVSSDTFTGMVAAPEVTAVDSTGAGDTFNGAIAVALSQQQSLHDAVVFACKAAAISVTKAGAQSSIPYLHEIVS